MASESRRRALYLTYDALAGQIGQSQILPYLLGLAGRGHALTVVSFEIAPPDSPLRRTVSAKLEAAGIRWRPRRFRTHPPYLAKAADALDLRRIATRLVEENRFDIIHCRSYVPAGAALALSRRTGARFLFDMRGFWVDQRREGGRWPQSNPLFRVLYRRWKTKERAFVAGADAIVTLSDAARKEIEDWPAYRGAPIETIPCAVDFDAFPLATWPQRKEARARLDIAPEATTLVYLGSLGTVYRFDAMLRFFVALRRARPGARFLLIGAHDPADIEAQARQIDPALSRLDFRFVRCLHSEASYWLGAGDMAICFITPTWSSLGVSPTKLGEYLAAGLPVLANAGVGDVERIVQSLDAGYVVSKLDEAALERAVKVMMDRIGADRAALRERARPSHDMPQAIALYDALYARLRRPM